MFRYLAILFLAIWMINRATLMLFSDRAIDQFGVTTKRKLDPLGYWVITGLWCACAAASIIGLVFLTYCAITSSGPYKDQAFFSMHVEWQLVLFLLPGSWLAYKAVSDWVGWARSRRRRDAA